MDLAIDNRREWKDGEQKQIEEFFPAVWKEVTEEVNYEMEITGFSPRDVTFTVDGKHRIFGRPRRYKKTYPSIGGHRTRETDGFGIYVEHKVPTSRQEPAHLDEYLHTARETPGGLVREVVTIPIQIIAGQVVESIPR